MSGVKDLFAKIVELENRIQKAKNDINTTEDIDKLTEDVKEIRQKITVIQAECQHIHCIEMDIARIRINCCLDCKYAVDTKLKSLWSK